MIVETFTRIFVGADLLDKTIQVDRLDPYVAKLREAGLEQLQPVQKTPVGHNARFRHPDGLVVEYVDHHR